MQRRHKKMIRARHPQQVVLENLESRMLLSATVAQMVSALDIAGVSHATYSGNSAAVTVLSRTATTSLLGFPSGVDNDFLLLSTGKAADVTTLANTSGSQGTDLGVGGVTGDTAKIAFDLVVPKSQSTQMLKFDFVFLSEEYPEYVHSSYNDFFTATVNGTNIAKDQNGNVVDVNNVFFNGSLSTAGTFFDGRTSLLTASYTVPSGTTTLHLEFSIGDVGDGIYDSAVILDHLRFETAQVVYLDFDGQSNLTFNNTTWNMPAFQATDLGYANNNNQTTVIDSMVSKLETLYSGLNISFTTTKPTTGIFSTLYIGGNDNALNSSPTSTLFGQAQSVDIGNMARDDNAVIFSSEFGTFYHTDSADVVRDRLAITISHELGHLLGLRHLENTYTDDVMKKNSPRSSSATFTDEVRNLATVEYWPDAATTQNDEAYLESVLGTTSASSALTSSWKELRNLLGSYITLDLSTLGTLYNVKIGTYDIAAPGAGGEVDSDIAPQTISLSKLSGVQTFFLPNFTGDDKFFLIGSSKKGGKADVTTGALNADGSIALDAAAVDYMSNQGSVISGLTLNKVDSSGTLQSLGTVKLAANALLKNTGTFKDADGDVYTVKLSAPGVISYAMSDANGDGYGSIDELILTGTSATKSTLSISVKKNKLGDGLVTIGSITGSALKSISASASDLTGAGITLDGLGALSLHDILSGADLSIGSQTKSTSLKARVIADGTTMTLGSAVSTLQAVAIGDGTITAPSITTLKVTGAKGIVGNMKSDVTLTGAVGTTVLKTMSVAGTLLNATIQGGVGNLGTITLGAVTDSNILTGYAGTTAPTSLSDFTSASTISTVKVTGIKGITTAIAGLFVAARYINTFSGVNPTTSDASTVAADSIKSVSLTYVDPITHKKKTYFARKPTDPLNPSQIQGVNFILLS